MEWAAVFAALFNWLANLTSWGREHQLVKQGEATQKNAELNAGIDFIAEADKAREDARARNRLVPPTDSLPDDGFRRD